MDTYPDIAEELGVFALVGDITVNRENTAAAYGNMPSGDASSAGA